MALTVHARLGRGRTVETFAATLEVGQERLEVVVKRPRPEFADNAAFTTALKEWGRAASEWDHDRVVAVLEAGETGEGVYVILEHVDGVPLAGVLAALRKRKRTFKPAHAVVIARKVAEALAYLATTARPGHGDLDPGEILLTYRGEVQVTDPQLSRLAAHVGADLLDDDAGPRAHYRAPEVAAGAAATPASDVYALGLVLLEMLIGHPIWTAERMTVAEAIAALGDFTHIGQASPALTQDLLSLLRRCLADAPADRPTPAQMQAGLQQIQASQGLDDDPLGLGTFVEAILPPRDDEEAPTMMMTAEQAEARAEAQASAADWDAASVLVDPQIEQRAQDYLLGRRAAAGASGPRPDSGPPVPALPVDEPAPTPAQPLLVAASVPLEDASVAKLEAQAKEVGRQARAARGPSGGPTRPPGARDEAQAHTARVRDVSRAAPEPSPLAGLARGLGALLEDRRRRAVVAGAAIVAALGIVMLAAGGGEAARTIELRATSEPSPAELFVDGEHVGQTPFEQPIEAMGAQVELRFERIGYRPHEVSIGTDARRLRYEASLTRIAEGDEP